MNLNNDKEKVREEHTSRVDIEKNSVETQVNNEIFVTEINKNSLMIDSNRQQKIHTVVNTGHVDINEQIYNKTNKVNYCTKNSDENNIEADNKNEQDSGEESFDMFILCNFVPFSGRQNVVQWLDETENKFKNFRIGRDHRFDAISLLVEGEAERQYIKNRKYINSFDDFYEFLLAQFEIVDIKESHSHFQQGAASNLCSQSTINQNNSTNCSHQIISNNSNTNIPINQSVESNSTTLVNLGTTNVTGDVSAVKSTVIPEDISILPPDQTASDIRRAIVDTLIKNPKVFKGGKDNVTKWIEEMEHLFDIAHISDSIKLDFVSYSLRGDALEWFRINRSSLTTWKLFVQELKRSFTSSFHEELAFKKLETYSQGENQSVRNFFNEVLKLCKEADSTMSEATKLKNLLNKAKPSIQYEVRKKKPITTSQFLEFAKEAEELIQLSAFSIDEVDSNLHHRYGNHTNIDNNKQTISQTSIPSLVSASSVPESSAFHNKSPNFSNNYSKQLTNSYRFTNNRNNYSNSNTSSFSHLQSQQNKSRHANNFSRPNRQYSSHNPNNNNYKRYPQQQTNFTRNTDNRQNVVNSINQSCASVNTELPVESFSSVTCNRCHQIGHGLRPVRLFSSGGFE
ncbi:unnamed protein product [Rotaria magnacalcarata]|nr:unnamed protein product [Rotaria magnacalcarata]CAF3999819.1 unnamed protein product [Rotaria magnacalcarata]